MQLLRLQFVENFGLYPAGALTLCVATSTHVMCVILMKSGNYYVTAITSLINYIYVIYLVAMLRLSYHRFFAVINKLLLSSRSIDISRLFTWHSGSW